MEADEFEIIALPELEARARTFHGSAQHMDRFQARIQGAEPNDVTSAMNLAGMWSFRTLEPDQEDCLVVAVALKPEGSHDPEARKIANMSDDCVVIRGNE